MVEMESDPEFDRLIAWFVHERPKLCEAAQLDNISVVSRDANNADVCFRLERSGAVAYCPDPAAVLPAAMFSRPAPALTRIRSKDQQRPNDPCGCGSGRKYRKCCGL